MILDVDGQFNIIDLVKLAVLAIDIEGLIASVIALRLCGCLSSPQVHFPVG